MANSVHQVLSLFFFFALLVCNSNGQLSPTFYSTSCPNLQTVVRSAMTQALRTNARTAASILRVFFHDCFVNGCDGSILLDGTSGEKGSFPNRNIPDSVFGVIDTIKTQVEAACSGVVSCSDILALAARDGVFLQNGQSWTVPLGRRDATTPGTETLSNNQIPGPADNLPRLISLFSAKGLTASEMTVLSGSHTIGQADCSAFRNHIWNETNIDPSFAATRRANCPLTGGDSNLAPLDIQTPTRFDNTYFQNLVQQRGLLHSDQELFNNGSQDSLVRTYSLNNGRFVSDFAAAMVKMGNISPLTGTQGEIRRNCRRAN